jgi:peptidoglycan/LPS O-acetylase OafA/YrhL
MRDEMQRSQRDLALEACRGLAAIIVVLWHVMLGFFPNRAGIFPNFDPGKSIAGEFWFGLVHGSSAVIFFFVLSGFVLTRRCFTKGDPSAIIRGAFKRWPRLAGPVTAVTLFSWLLFAINLYDFEEAGRITGSPWLAKFAFSTWPFEPSFWDALTQGVYFTFFRGDAYYDSSLWTMHYEFVGSFIAFGLVLLLQPIHRDRPVLAAAFLMGAGLLCHFASPLYVAFPIGVALAAFLPSDRKGLQTWLAASMVICALYLLGYTQSAGKHFTPLTWIVPSGMSPFYVHMVGASLIIIAAERSDLLRRVLSGRWAAKLGELSFPVYLVHILVLSSVGSWVLATASRLVPPPYPNIIAALVTIGATFVCAMPLAGFDVWWTKKVNLWTFRMLRSPVGSDPNRTSAPLRRGASDR